MRVKRASSSKVAREGMGMSIVVEGHVAKPVLDRGTGEGRERVRKRCSGWEGDGKRSAAVFSMGVEVIDVESWGRGLIAGMVERSGRAVRSVCFSDKAVERRISVDSLTMERRLG